MQLLKLGIVVLLASMLAACGTSRPASVAGGECKIFTVPEYAVKGATSYDQNWIDDTTEGMVAGCGQPRPKARPTSLDAPSPPKNAPAVIGADPQGTPAPAKKKHWWSRFRKTPTS